MNASFGLDHPLIATRNIERLRNRLIALGFNMTAIGKHPWGTSTSLAMFNGCLLEIMGVYDETLIDAVPAGDFHFGRHVYEHLQQREGVALTALHSTDSQSDAQRAAACGFHIAGHLEFGRDVVLPDGTVERTKTTLAVMPDPCFPRLSFFLCQQHRPDLIYVPEWLVHPNGVTGLCGVTIAADVSDHVVLKTRFEGLYGPPKQIPGGMAFQTANGMLRIMERAAFSTEIGVLPKAIAREHEPCIAGMDFSFSDGERLRRFLNSSGASFIEHADGMTLSQTISNTVFRFLRSCNI